MATEPGPAPKTKRARKPRAPKSVTPGAKPEAAKENAKVAAPPKPDSGFPAPDPSALAQNLLAMTGEALKAAATYAKYAGSAKGVTVADPLNIGATFSAYLQSALKRPAKLLAAQAELAGAHLRLWKNTAKRLLGGTTDPVADALPGDKRFKDAAWQDNQIFDFLKQSYLITSDWLRRAADDANDLDAPTRHKLRFYANQIADALAPTNFVLTNPEVLRETLRTNGANLVKGLTHVAEDLERGKGRLQPRQSDDTKFKIGGNVATAPGKVVYRNDLMELLQFDPSTDEVYETPLLIVPPWINKFYILDLKPENSFIRWATARGHTVFVVSWVNPDARLAAKTFADYMHEGIFEALDAVQKAAGVKRANVIGYCIGGTLLAAALAHMAARNDNRVNTATFFAAQADFTAAGDLQVFIDDQQLQNMEAQMRAQGGYLDGGAMATTFNMLRSNDLIWSVIINNYLMGRDPPAFDLLYWNSDSTRMPVEMHMQYLRDCYRDNKLAEGRMTLGNVRLDLSKVTVPVWMQASKEDHIAPALSVFKSSRLFKGPVTFMVAGSGHIAGVINPPSAKKYQHWMNSKPVKTLEEWWAGATEYPGSWWEHWDEWLAPQSGGKVPARVPGKGGLKALGPAPGTYVTMK